MHGVTIKKNVRVYIYIYIYIYHITHNVDASLENYNNQKTIPLLPLQVFRSCCRENYTFTFIKKMAMSGIKRPPSIPVTTKICCIVRGFRYCPCVHYLATLTFIKITQNRLCTKMSVCHLIQRISRAHRARNKPGPPIWKPKEWLPYARTADFRY